MNLTLLKKRAAQVNDIGTKPNWVTNKNKSLAIYECANKLKKELSSFIKQQKNVSAFKKKSNYQISLSQVARSVGMAVPTLANTSSYSQDVKTFIDKINSDLEKKKDIRLISIQRNKPTSLNARKKDELVNRCHKLEKELKKTKQLNVDAQVSRVLGTLSLPVKRKLGI